MLFQLQVTAVAFAVVFVNQLIHGAPWSTLVLVWKNGFSDRSAEVPLLKHHFSVWLDEESQSGPVLSSGSPPVTPELL